MVYNGKTKLTLFRLKRSIATQHLPLVLTSIMIFFYATFADVVPGQILAIDDWKLHTCRRWELESLPNSVGNSYFIISPSISFNIYDCIMFFTCRLQAIQAKS